MRTLYLGDIVGRSGRHAVLESLGRWRQELQLDLVLVNVENAAAGFGVTAQICDELLQAGADVLLTGNHVWDKRDIIPYLEREPRLLRPLNFPARTPGRGARVFPLRDGRNALVAQVQGRVFMEPLDDPFAAADTVLANVRLGREVQFALLDIHAEATSEKMALAHHLDGRVSAVFGTHTHVPSADAQILNGGTAYMSDLGMCGDYDSVIGMDKEEPLRRFLRKIPDERFAPAMGPATVCGVYLETDDSTGRARYVAPLRQGPRLAPAWSEPPAETASPAA